MYNDAIIKFEERSLLSNSNMLDISYPIEKIHAQTFGIKISTGKNRQFEIVFCKEKQCCFVDRTTAGVNPH